MMPLRENNLLHRQTERDRQTDRQTERQRDRDTDTERQPETDRQRNRERERAIKSGCFFTALQSYMATNNKKTNLLLVIGSTDKDHLKHYYTFSDTYIIHT